MKLLHPVPELVLLIDWSRFPASAWEWLPSLQGVADVLLIRVKGEPEATQMAAMERVRTLSPTATLWLNGALSVARAVAAQGLHLPAQAEAAQSMRRQWSGYLTASVHSAGEALRHQGADTLVWGHAFATRSKPDLAPRTTLQDVLGTARQPVLAIGGINPDTVGQLKGLGLAGVVVGDGVWCQDNPVDAAQYIKNIVARSEWKEVRKGAMGCS